MYIFVSHKKPGADRNDRHPVLFKNNLLLIDHVVDKLLGVFGLICYELEFLDAAV